MMPLHVTPEVLELMRAQYGDVVSFPLVDGKRQVGQLDQFQASISPEQRFVLTEPA